MKRIGVILSGCGVYDGSEIHEAVLALLAIERAGARLYAWPQIYSSCMSSTILTVKPRTANSAACCLSRRVSPVACGRCGHRQCSGYRRSGDSRRLRSGQNLCDFAVKGAECTVQHDVEQLVRDMVDKGKPVAAICIAPAVLAKALQDTRRA